MKLLIFIALLFVGFSLQQTTPAGTAVQETSVPTGTGGETEGQCEYPPLLGAIPSLFNVFVFDDFQGANSEVGGRLAAGGNAFLTSYSVASALPLVVCPAPNTGNGTGYTTATSNTSNTEFFDNLIVGGALTWDTGSLKTGNIVVGAPSQISPSVTSGLQQPCGVVQNSTRIDFVFWEAFLVDLSNKLSLTHQDTKVAASLDSNNVLTIPLDIAALESGSSTSATGSEEESEDNVQVIDVNAADLLQANTVTFQGSTAATTPVATTPVATTPVATTPVATNLATTPEATSGGEETGNKTVLIFNVAGSPCGFKNVGIQSLAPWAKKIIWNFQDCTNMTILSVSVPGTVLAPGAAVYGASGDLAGQLIAVSFNGSLAFINTLFEGCVDLGNETSSTAATQAGSVPGTALQTVPDTVAVDGRNVQLGWWGMEEEPADQNSAPASALATALAPLVVLAFWLGM
jgi:choice-of-anchor A domain-containing protein